VPIYEFICFEDYHVVTELRKVGDFAAPQCPRCGKLMTKVISPVSFVLKGIGWNRGEWGLLRKRSEDQGKKFFRHHSDKQELVSKTIEKKRREE